MTTGLRLRGGNNKEDLTPSPRGLLHVPFVCVQSVPELPEQDLFLLVLWIVQEARGLVEGRHGRDWIEQSANYESFHFFVTVPADEDERE